MGRTRNPFRGLMDHMSEMARMREYAEGGGQEDQRRTHATAWIPTTDIFARGDDLVIRCELPGVSRDDIDISLVNGVLSVSGERRSELAVHPRPTAAIRLAAHATMLRRRRR